MLSTPGKEVRTILRACRFSPEEDERLERLAKAGSYRSVSAYLRACSGVELVERRAKRRPKRGATVLAAVPDPRASDYAVAMLIEQLRRAGVNLNQIARHLNEGRVHLPELERDVRAALAELLFVTRQARDL